MGPLDSQNTPPGLKGAPPLKGDAAPVEEGPLGDVITDGVFAELVAEPLPEPTLAMTTIFDADAQKLSLVAKPASPRTDAANAEIVALMEDEAKGKPTPSAEPPDGTFAASPLTVDGGAVTAAPELDSQFLFQSQKPKEDEVSGAVNVPAQIDETAPQQMQGHASELGAQIPRTTPVEQLQAPLAQPSLLKPAPTPDIVASPIAAVAGREVLKDGEPFSQLRTLDGQGAPANQSVPPQTPSLPVQTLPTVFAVSDRQLPLSGAKSEQQWFDLAPLSQASGELGQSRGAGPSLNAPPQVDGRAVAVQIAAGMIKQKNGTIEIRLDPPELGRVSVSLTSGDDTISAVIAVDRPETGDLLRRHAEHLQRALRDAGYDDVTLDFSGTDDGADASHSQETPLSDALPAEPDSTEAPPTQQIHVAQSGLDIRL